MEANGEDYSPWIYNVLMAASREFCEARERYNEKSVGSPLAPTNNAQVSASLREGFNALVANRSQ